MPAPPGGCLVIPLSTSGRYTPGLISAGRVLRMIRE
jgi:hypothetical protein